MKELVVKIKVPSDDNKSAETYVRNMWDKSNKKYVVASMLLTLVEKDEFKNLISSGCTEEEVETATAALMAALEPLMIILLAGVCMTIIGAVMAPMAAMYTGLDNL